MLRRKKFDLMGFGGFALDNCIEIKRICKIRRWRKVRKTDRKRRYAHWTFYRGRILLKKYLINKRLWYSQKKHCLLGGSFEKKQELFTFSYDKKITLQSKIIDFNKKV